MKSGSLFVVFLILACVGGYLANIVKFVDCDFQANPSTKCEVVRGIGIPLWPMGIITGYISEDTLGK